MACECGLSRIALLAMCQSHWQWMTCLQMQNKYIFIVIEKCPSGGYTNSLITWHHCSEPQVVPLPQSVSSYYHQASLLEITTPPMQNRIRRERNKSFQFVQCGHLDVTGIGQEHCHTVNSHAPASRRGEAIFQGSTKAFIHHLCFVISCLFVLWEQLVNLYTRQWAGLGHLSLLLESFPLHHWIIQFSVGITNFLLTYK